MSRLDADALLRRALERSADAAGLNLTVTRSDSARWASATFNGARHELTLVLPDNPAAAAWLHHVPDAELSLRGHLVADATVVRTTRADGRMTASLEALTVEDC